MEEDIGIACSGEGHDELVIPEEWLEFAGSGDGGEFCVAGLFVTFPIEGDVEGLFWVDGAFVFFGEAG